MQRKNITGETRWESIVGYSRAVRVGPQIYLSGTTATDKTTGTIVGQNDVYAQTMQVIRNIDDALRKLDSRLKDIVRTRIYVINIANDWKKVGRAHAELFKNINPATTMVEVSSLISPEILVEIEADTIVNNAQSKSMR